MLVLNYVSNLGGEGGNINKPKLPWANGITDIYTHTHFATRVL